MRLFSDFDSRVVRQDSCGVEFNSLIADPVGELWYDTPRHPQITIDEAKRLPLRLDRKAEAGWKELGILRDFLVRPGDRIVECGCHHGLTTVMLAAWTGPKGFVRAFDAVLFNALVAKRNLELNMITNAAVYCAAIGGKRQLVNCYNESNVIVRADETAGAVSTVMVTLSDVVQEPPDVLKLDVEGCELEILESSSKLLSSIPKLAIELHTDMLPPDGVSRVLEILKPRPLHVLWEDGSFTRYDGRRISQRVHLFAY
jgi:FkbM family methyltransferase